MQEALFRRLALLTLASVAVRIASAVVVAQPGYTDAYYYVNVASRAARALGASVNGSLIAGAVVGLGGVFAPAWVSVDGFAPAALLGTLFFIVFARAAQGGVIAGALAGLAVGLLYLVRAEGAMFGLALVALALRRRSRGAGVAGALVALAIGGAWLARDLSIGP